MSGRTARIHTAWIAVAVAAILLAGFVGLSPSLRCELTGGTYVHPAVWIWTASGTEPGTLIEMPAVDEGYEVTLGRGVCRR